MGAELGCHLGKEGPVTLAAGVDEIPGDLGEKGILGLGDLVEAGFDALETIPHRFEGDQVLKIGSSHAGDGSDDAVPPALASYHIE
jgi:hypothetical protein